MLIAFGITAIFRPCLTVPAPPLLEELPAAPAALLVDDVDDELPHAARAMAAATTGIQRMPLMRMGASPWGGRSGDDLDAGGGGGDGGTGRGAAGAGAGDGPVT